MVERVKIKASIKPNKRKLVQVELEDAIDVVVERQRGNTSKYNPETFPKTARFLAARGAIQSEIAGALSVSTRTLQNYLNQFPEMREAINAGNGAFNPRVERALAERALGFFVDIGEERVLNPETGQYEMKTIRKYFPPDTTAIIFFLKNRMRHKYRDVQDVNHSGHVLQSSDELLRELRKGLVELQAEGVLTGVALPAPKGNGKANGKGNGADRHD